ncbi:MAG: TROVE domain-containing protein [Clostridia bacterium]|nr:TROVE domain-containing protein [Clostridia bacterium]
MNRITKKVKQAARIEKLKPTVNFMGGVSYRMNPLDTLKMIAASSVFGEPQYYRDGEDVPNTMDSAVKGYALFDFDGKTTSQVFLEAAQASLDHDFKGTVELAAELRSVYQMRLNPQIIMVMAASHPFRREFDEKHPGEFRKINLKVMSRADEPAAQFSAWLYLHEGSKAGLPSVLKRSWADKLGSLTAYQIGKYKNAEAGMIDTVRVCHAKGKLIGELMETGAVQVKESEKTWENLRSAGKSFREIFGSIKMPHMALLRNLRNILSEVTDRSKESRAYVKEVLDRLVQGVEGGKQFPFRYYSALDALVKEDRASAVPFIELAKDALEQCVDKSIDGMPRLKGRTACLSDNSSSAGNGFPSEYGTMDMACIGNLSSVVAGKLSDKAVVGLFGDRLTMVEVSQAKGCLEQARRLDDQGGRVGGGTENGIWLFFRDAIEKKESYDNIFVFSDQQAGHGGLYGTGSSYVIGGKDFRLEGRSRYIDVLALLKEYKSKVNPRVNFFTVQTAGYPNALIPEYIHRGAVLTGWTGKEAVFAAEIIRQWDQLEAK